MKIFLIRHGETENNKQRIIQGSIDDGLTLKGTKQAEAVSERLKDEQIDLILSSNYKRAVETAEKIRINHPRSRFILKEELKERDYGIFNGKSLSSVDKTHPSIETKETVLKRTKRLLDFLKSQKVENILIVCHGSIGKILLQLLVGKEEINKHTFEFLKNCSLSVIELMDKTKKILTLNSTEHLEKEIIFMGGGDYRKNENIEIDQLVVNKIGKSGKIVFIPFAINDSLKRENRFIAVKTAYESLGLTNIECLDETKMNSREMMLKISSSDALFLLGGDPRLLLDKLNEFGLIQQLSLFKGLIVGFSAGAMILSDKLIIPGGIDENYPEDSTYLGLGLVSFSIIPHYTPNIEEKIVNSLKGVEAYGLTNSSAIVFDQLTKEVYKIGSVFHFN